MGRIDSATLWGPAPRSGLGRPAAHTREEITAAAIAIADADGLSAVSMRRVAAAIGGLVGVAFGFAIAVVVSQLTPLPYSLTWWSIALGIGISSLVGIVFGIYPAAKAARLDPIAALRFE